MDTRSEIGLMNGVSSLLKQSLQIFRCLQISTRITRQKRCIEYRESEIAVHYTRRPLVVFIFFHWPDMRAAVVLKSPFLNCELVVLASIKTGQFLNRYSRSIAETFGPV